MRSLLVYGGNTNTRRTPRPNGSREARTIVAARTKAGALALLNQVGRVTLYQLNAYWCQTHNRLELETATEEGVWIDHGLDFSPAFERVKLR